jgi:hypothetical protein
MIERYSETMMSRICRAVLPTCGGFCGASECRVLSAKDLRCHFPHEPLLLSTLFVNELDLTPADS